MTYIQFTDDYYHPLDSNSRKEELIIKISQQIKLQNKAKEFFDSLVVFSDDHHNRYVLALKLFKKPILGNGPKGFQTIL